MGRPCCNILAWEKNCSRQPSSTQRGCFTTVSVVIDKESKNALKLKPQQLIHCGFSLQALSLSQGVSQKRRPQGTKTESERKMRFPNLPPLFVLALTAAAKKVTGWNDFLTTTNPGSSLLFECRLRLA